jgi:hypothetical protein
MLEKNMKKIIQMAPAPEPSIQIRKVINITVEYLSFGSNLCLFFSLLKQFLLIVSEESRS